MAYVPVQELAPQFEASFLGDNGDDNVVSYLNILNRAFIFDLVKAQPTFTILSYVRRRRTVVSLNPVMSPSRMSVNSSHKMLNHKFILFV